MNWILIALALAMVMMVSMGADYGPINMRQGAGINFTDGDVTNLHNLTLDDDGADIDFNGRNITYGGYAQSGKLAPQSSVNVFLFTVPWIGTQVAVAQREDGWPVSISTNNATVLNAAFAYQHVKLWNMFTATSTIWANRTIDIEGIGYLSGIRGSVNPLIRTDTNYDHKFSLSHMSINTTGNNDGVYIDKITPVSNLYSHSFAVDDVDFHAEIAGSGMRALLKVAGPPQFKLSRSQFYGDVPSGGAGDTIGLYLFSNNATGRSIINPSVDQCEFANLAAGIRCEDINAVPGTGNLAGLRIVNTLIIGCKYGLYVIGCDEVTLTGSMIDWANTALKFVDVNRPIIVGNWFASGAYVSASEAGIQFVSATGIKGNGVFSNNYVLESAVQFAMVVSAIGTNYTDSFRITDNIFIQDGHADGIAFVGDVLRCRFQNNMLWSVPDGHTFIYIINADVEHLYIQGNNMYGAGGNIADAGTGTVKTNNYDDDVAV